MNENGYISELIPTEQVTFFLLVTNFWYFFHPCTWRTQGPAPDSRQHLYKTC
jgi:hypothetical protein